jgi:hypothetical protein
LQVPDGHLLPHAQEALVSLGSELPFGRVTEHLKSMLGVVVHASTTRRQRLSVGQRMLQIQNEQAQPLAACPEEQAAERMAMSSDGAMVPLVGGVWAEVKGVAIGAVERRRHKGEEEIVTTKLTYFARMAPAATFADQGSRGRAQAGHRARQARLCHPGWGRVDPRRMSQGHRHDALRMLDFAHAASYFNEIADKVRDGGGHLPAKWVDGVLHRLKHEGPARVLRQVSCRASRSPQIHPPGDLLAEATRADGLSDPTFSRAGRSGLAAWKAVTSS